MTILWMTTVLFFAAPKDADKAALPAPRKMITVLANEARYRNAKGREVEVAGVIVSRPGGGYALLTDAGLEHFPSLGNRKSSVAGLLGREVRVIGKLVVTETKGRSTTQLYPGSMLVLDPD